MPCPTLDPLPFETPVAAPSDTSLAVEHGLENARITAARLPLAAAVFLFSLGLIWIIERNAHPGRDATYAIVYGLEALAWLVAALWCRRTVNDPTGCLTAAVSGAIAQIVLIAGYHVVAHGEAEILALALVYFGVGMMVMIPWGARGQLLVTSVSVVAFVIAVSLGVSAVTPISLHLVGLLCIGAVTILSAAALERHRFGVISRAAELRNANTGLQRAYQALAAADRAKTQVLANVSHELRTPLSVMIGYTDLIRDGVFGELSAPLRETIERIHANSEMLLSLANDLLDLSRLQANKIDLRLESVQLASLCAEAATCIPSLLGEKPVALSIEVADDSEAIGDRARLRQVLVNLLTNAAKFTQRGRIRVQARALDATTQLIEVADTGIGIPIGEQAAIFEPFKRGSQTGEVGGAGIGLALSRQLAEAMGGQLTVASELGVGSTFTVRLKRPTGAEPVRPANV